MMAIVDRPTCMPTLFCIVLLAALSSVSCVPKPPRVIPPSNPNDPPALPPGTTKTVLIAGGGLAGLSAALELSERGYQVTIKEAEEILGGRLFTRPIIRLGQTFHIEHGFHGWFHNYHNFKDIRQRLKIEDNFKPWGAVHYIFKQYKPEAIYSTGPYPLNLIGIILRSPNLSLEDAIASSLSLPDLLEFDYNNVFEKYGNITLLEWAKLREVNQKFFDIIMRPSLSVTVNERTIISAAEMLMYMQLYFLSDPQADTRLVAKYNYGKAVINPWAEYLQQRNVKILVNSTVKGLRFDTKTGNVLGDIDDKTDYDHVVMATNLIGIKGMLNTSMTLYKNSPVVNKSLSMIINKISGLKLAPLYKVMRVWFDRQLSNVNDTPVILETPDFSPVNLVVQYHRLEQEFIEWSEKSNGSVVEFHLYAWKHGNVSDDKIWGIISPTVKLIYPELLDFQMLAYHVHSFHNFPSFQTGSEIFRPNSTFASACGIPNLAFAGDWLHTSYPSALMERAVSTGREAANQVLLSDHVRQVNLTVTSSFGPGIL